MKVEIREPDPTVSPTASFSACKTEEQKEKLTRLVVLTLREKVSTTAIFFSRRLEDIRKYETYKLLGYESWSDFVHQEFDRSAEEIDQKILAYSKLEGSTKVPALRPQGVRGPGREKRGSVTTSFPMGRGSTYLRARLARDNPEILADLEAGKYRSVRQAAIAAGIVKEKDRAEKALDLVRKMSAEERAKFDAGLAEL